MKIKKLLLIIFVFYSILATSQTKEDVEKIVKNYDTEKIKAKIIELKKTQFDQKQKALSLAKIKGWPEFIKNKNGTTDELMAVTPDGYPLYYSNNNVNAAKSTRANHLNTGGSLGLTLNGEGMVARVWDGGTVRRTHTFLTGRITTVDDVAGVDFANQNSDHATHVTGTIISNSVGSSKGMATAGSARTFNWTDDRSEALSEVLGGMLLSNHSYGVPVTNPTTGVTLPSWYIGAYSDAARSWDEVAFLSPYYLPVMSAGNDGGNINNSNPITFGYDKLTSDKTAKNTLVVANAQDAVVAANGTLTSVLISASSSQGPTDDRRIKPDITGNGETVTSCSSSTNSSTVVKSGTSMASPNVTGTLLLIQQHHKNLTSFFMKAATLKGLACHTADDSGNPGPDAKFGWGLLNAKKAVETLTGNGLTSWVSENSLNQGQTYNMTVKSDGVNPLIASITWTDVPGTAATETTPDNDATNRAIVNDLDIRITKASTTYFPWKLELDPTLNAIRIGDNNVDNVEQIKIDAPVAGDYIVTITHKGTLVNGKQNYSLVVTGVTSPFSLTSTTSDLELCSNQNAVYTFAYKQSGAGTTTFSATTLPLGAVASFSPSSLSANGNVTMTISGLSNVTPGDYNVGIIGTNGTDTETRYKGLKIYNSTVQPISLSTPTNGQTTLSTSVKLVWIKNNNVENYNVQVSTVSNFATTFLNTTTAADNYIVSGLSQETYYYWRVIPSNRCGTGIAANAPVNSFQTGRLVCGNVFTATDFSNATIAATANASAIIPINITGGINIGKVSVDLNLTHTYIQDMTIYLEGPATIGSPKVLLFKEACGDNDDINCTVDDAGVAITCGATSPAISGTVKSYESLTGFNGMLADGTWTLHVEDPYNGDGGSVSAVSVTLCNLLPSLGLNENEFENISIYPNPTKGMINISITENDILDDITFNLYDIQGRSIKKVKATMKHEILNLENLQDGVYFLSIESGNKKSTRKIILNK